MPKAYVIWNEIPEGFKIYEITESEFETYGDCHNSYLGASENSEDVEEKLDELYNILKDREPLFKEFNASAFISLNGIVIVSGQML